MKLSTALRASWVLAAALAGCKGEPFQPDARIDADPPIDAYQPPWWTPRAGELADWDIQLAPPYDVSASRSVYVLPLWELAPATTLDYGDGEPVAVPAGALAGKIDELHARTPRNRVICHFDTAAIDLSDPDAVKFGYDPADPPPDRPTPVPTGGMLGWSTVNVSDAEDPTFNPNERLLDIRAASRARWAPYMWKRFDLAQQLGCDGIDGDNNDVYAMYLHLGDGWGTEADPLAGLDITQETSWYEEVGAQAHAREMAAGMKNGHFSSGAVDGLAQQLDWALPERCAEQMTCDNVRAFLNLRKPVLALDYMAPDADGLGIDVATACGRYAVAQIEDGVVRHQSLAGGTFRMACP